MLCSFTERIEMEVSSVTIKEIAKETGYGIGTVSRVLNNSGSVSEKARKEITAVIEKYHFQPNVNARHLKMQTSFGIAIIVKGIENMFFLELTEAIQKNIRENGYECLTYYIDEDDDELEEAQKIVEERRPFGIMFLGSNTDIEHRKLLVKDLDVPCIVITDNTVALGLSNLSSIGVDDSMAASYAIEYLYDKGHRKIGIIGGNPETSQPSRMRLEGCQISFFRHNLPFDPEKCFSYSHYNLKGGYDAAMDLMQKYPDMTAVFAMSDMMAIGAIRAFYSSGKRIPSDISVMGFDGIELARYVHPRLTTIRQDIEKLACRGTEILLNCIQNSSEEIHEVISFELQEGSSVREL